MRFQLLLFKISTILISKFEYRLKSIHTSVFIVIFFFKKVIDKSILPILEVVIFIHVLILAK